jgi:hypothetical protein
MNHFPPDKQQGLIIHSALILLCAALVVGATIGAFSAGSGIGFTLWIIAALIAIAPIPFLIYRAYALSRSDYQIDRETLRLIWGLRIEEIPIGDVEWLRPIGSIPTPPSLPLFSFAGGVLGITRHADLGSIEFMASDAKNLLLIATRKQIFAISPADAAGFVNTFQHTIELGSLTTFQGQSQYPSFAVVQAWAHPITRYLWLSNILLNAGLAIWISILATSIAKVTLGFTASGNPLEAMPGISLVILPLISIPLSLLSWVAGLYFYRRKREHALAFVLWASSALMSLIILIAVVFLVTTPV